MSTESNNVLQWTNAGSAAAGAATGLIGGISSAVQAKRQNKLVSVRLSDGRVVKVSRKNRDALNMQDWQNQYNAQQAQIARDWQAEQSRIARDYDSAKAVKQRYIDAGINPYLAMSGQQVATATTSPAGANAQSSSAEVQPYVDPSASFRNMASGFDSLGQMASAVQQVQSNSFKLPYDVDVMLKNIRSMDLSNEQKGMLNAITNATMLQSMQQADLQNQFLKVQIDQFKLGNVRQKIENSNLDSVLKSSMSRNIASALESFSHSSVYEQTIQNMKQEILESKNRIQTNNVLQKYYKAFAALLGAQTIYTMSQNDGQLLQNKITKDTLSDTIGIVSETYLSQVFDNGLKAMGIEVRDKLKDKGFNFYGSKSLFDAMNVNASPSALQTRDEIEYAPVISANAQMGEMGISLLQQLQQFGNKKPKSSAKPKPNSRTMSPGRAARLASRGRVLM